MSDSIYKIVQNYELSFLDNPVKIVDGYNFNQLKTIKDNQRYYASKFESGDTDEFGYKYFFNIVKSRVKNAAKNLDLDTKDINIKATQPDNYYKTWIMRRDIRQWMKKRHLGQIFNSMVMMTPKYGTFVLKKIKGKEIVREIDLKNIKNDPTCKKLEESGWIIEDHFYTPYELKKEVERGWNKTAIDKAIKSFKTNRKENYVENRPENDNTQGNAQYIKVKEFYGEVPENTFDPKGDEDKFVMVNYILVSPEGGIKPDNDKDAEKEGLMLYKGEIDEIPYKEVHYDREEGRWLGVGIVEDLRDSQIMKNEEINQVMLALKLANLILFQTGDETTARNILTDLVNGDILKVKQALTRIDTRSIGMNENNIISREIEQLANALANSYEVTTGESLPSGTPFALGSLINQNANKLFDFIRENIGLFLEEVFEDWIIPELEKDLNEKHILELTDKREMDWVVKRFNSSHIWEKIKMFILEKGRKPTQAEVDMAVQVLEQRMIGKEHLYLDLPEKFYDFKKSVEVDITGESENKQATLQSLATILQMVGNKPELLENPAMKKIMDLSNFSEIDFGEIRPPEALQTPQTQGMPQVGQMMGQPA